MEFPILNKFEKKKKVIELHVAGRTIREISKIVKMSFRDISKIIKEYERKKELQAKKEENNQSTQPKKSPISTQAFKLFSDGKKLTDVTIDLEIPARKSLKLFSQFLEMERMEECYEFYQEYSYDIPNLLSISTFMKRNNISGSNIVNVLRTANNVYNLNQTYSNLKTEIKDLEQRRNYLLYTPSSPYSLQPLPLNKPKYNYYNY